MSDTSNADSESIDPADIRILERKEARLEGVPLFTAHWHLFIPTVVIAVLYSFCWLMLAVIGKMDSALARMFVIVMAVGVPLLAAHAFLRYQTIRLQVSDSHVFCHPGWPKDLPIDLPVKLIREVVIKRGLSGRLFGGGTILMNLSTGSRVVIADLGNPEAAKEEIERAMQNVNT